MDDDRIISMFFERSEDAIWDIYDDKENNPVVTSPRYKAAVERVRDSKG